MQPTSNLTASQAVMKFDVNNLRIASPCSVSWASMKGDERTRHCDLCELNVHNVAGMTRDEVAHLVGENSGRLCMRLYRRADGTVLTKDCPIGLRAFRKRVAGLASAAFATILGLMSVSYGQNKEIKKIDASKIQITRSVDPVGKSGFEGITTDENGAVIPNLRILLYQDRKKTLGETTSNSDGEFSLESVAPGVYTIEVVGAYGFQSLIVEKFQLRANEKPKVTLVLPASEHVMGIIITSDPNSIDLSTNERKTVITRDMLDRIPGGRPY